MCFQCVTPDIAEFLEKLKTRVRVGVVGGSDLIKIKEQLGSDGEGYGGAVKHRLRGISATLIFCSFVCAVIQKVDYVFAENGLVAYKNGQLHSVQVR